jgi:subtilisin family serine protease
MNITKAVSISFVAIIIVTSVYPVTHSMLDKKVYKDHNSCERKLMNFENTGPKLIDYLKVDKRVDKWVNQNSSSFLIERPIDGEIVSGIVPLKLSDGSNVTGVSFATFEYSEDGTNWAFIGTDNDGKDGWEVNWNTDNVEEGFYFIKVALTDIFGGNHQTHLQVWVEGASSIASMVCLTTYQFDTRVKEPDLPEKLMMDFSFLDESKYFIVQFAGPIKEEWKAQILKIGGEIYNYIPFFSFIVKMNETVKTELEKLRFVRWIGGYKPAYKIAPALLNASGLCNLSILVFEGKSWKEITAIIKRMGGTILFAEETDIGGLIKTQIDSERIIDIANIIDVEWMEPWREPICHNANATWVIQSGEPNKTPIWDMGLHGEGQIITICDSGLDGTGEDELNPFKHESFSHPRQMFEYGQENVNPDHRKIYQYYAPEGSDGDRADFTGHGTHVACTAAGDNTYNGFFKDPNGKGIAYKAKIIMQDIGSWRYWNHGKLPTLFPPENYSKMYQPAYDMGSRIHSNSWGLPGKGGQGYYSYLSEMIDEFMWRNKDFLILHSADNLGEPGSISLEGNAKNIITVGATKNGLDNMNMWEGSSRGPAGDGRLKPTVVAPGQWVVSAKYGTEREYLPGEGTSHSTPLVAGAAALIRQYFSEGWYPSGTKNHSDAFNPSAALIKAMLINSAVEINEDGAYNTPYDGMSFPNNDQGWGKINLDDSVFYSKAKGALQGRVRKLVVRDDDNISTGESIDYMVDISDVTEGFKVTLVWTDHAGNKLAKYAIQNDLDLQVTDPENNLYYGNVFSGCNPAQSASGGSRDWKNVEECVLILPPNVYPGKWKIKVIGSNVPYSPQPFAIVMTGGFANNENKDESSWNRDSLDDISCKISWLNRVTDKFRSIISIRVNTFIDLLRISCDRNILTYNCHMGKASCLNRR